MTKYSCISCGAPYPNEFAYICPECGGLFDVAGSIRYDPNKIESDLPGLWKYRHSFGLPENAPVVTLGEGNTPLIFSEGFDKEIGFKLEYLNPTGSFKDRLTAPEVSFLVSQGISEAVEDSSGNAGASFAAYAAAAGIRAKIYVPSYASGPKHKQIEAYGAELHPIPGPRSEAAKAVMDAVEDGAIYASHAYLPFGHAGLATIAYEIFEQLGQAPGTVIAPAGHGSLLLGIIYGFEALRLSHEIEKEPYYVGVQAAACAPIVLGAAGEESGDLVERETFAEGVSIKQPVRGETLINLSRSKNLDFISVEEDVILPGKAELAHRGMYVEPTSAIIWDGLQQVSNQVPEPIVAILTGSGLKSA